jgi:hypothetical protein
MGGDVMTAEKRLVLVAGGIGLGVAVVLAYLATRSAGPVAMSQFTELREGPLQEHLVTQEELGIIPAKERMHYPPLVAPGLTKAIAQGFAPSFEIPDPQAACLPAEVMW